MSGSATPAAGLVSAAGRVPGIAATTLPASGKIAASGFSPVAPYDSSDPGFLSPASSPFSDDLALDLVLQAWVVGLTRLTGAMVRPRWQPNEPPMPNQNVDWAAVGVLSSNRDNAAWFGHNPNNAGGLGDSTMQRHQTFEALLTCYGPNATHYGSLFADGAQVGQNRDVLAANDIMLTQTGPVQVVPELINQVWVRRADVHFTFNQQITRLYPIRTLTSVPVQITKSPESGPVIVLSGTVMPGQGTLGPSPTAKIGTLAEMQAQWVMGAEVTNGRFYFSFSTNYAGSITSLDYATAVGAFVVNIDLNGVPVPGMADLAVGATRLRALPLSATTFAAGSQITGVVSAATGTPTDAVLNLTVVWQ